MVTASFLTRPSTVLAIAVTAAVCLHTVGPAIAAADGGVLTTVENQVVTAAKGWESTVTNAAKSLFWILAGIEVGIAAAWLAIQAATIEAWFAELVRRIMFIGFFAFVLAEGPSFAKAVVDSLFQIGGGSGSASSRSPTSSISNAPTPRRTWPGSTPWPSNRRSSATSA
ncbi:type IV secretory pathway TrbL component [Bradyrhizobium barranii subsp. barranii]